MPINKNITKHTVGAQLIKNHLNHESMILVKHQYSNFAAITWRVQITLIRW